MDFDHVADKTALISRLVTQSSTERLLAEIAKCQVVRANCHRIRTQGRMADEVGPSTRIPAKVGPVSRTIPPAGM